MNKKLLISDANIIIDIVAGELVDAMFGLEYDFGVPDVLYADELEAQHSDILDAGLKLLELQSESVEYANTLFEKNVSLRVSAHDCMALSLAKQEFCTLLTGDSKLKQLAMVENVSVRGTLWLVEQMIDIGHITAEEAEIAYDKMLKDGSRLPAAEIQIQLKKYKDR